MSRETRFQPRRSRSSGRRPFCLRRPIAVWLCVLSEVVATIMRPANCDWATDEKRSTALIVQLQTVGVHYSRRYFVTDARANCPTFFESIPRRAAGGSRFADDMRRFVMSCWNKKRFNLAVNKINTRTRSRRAHTHGSRRSKSRDFYRSTNCSFKVDRWRRLF